MSTWLLRWLERHAWVRVVDRLPEPMRSVLLIEAATGKVYIGRWNEAGQYPDDKFSLWRPMPATPLVERDNEK